MTAAPACVCCAAAPGVVRLILRGAERRLCPDCWTAVQRAAPRTRGWRSAVLAVARERRRAASPG